MHSPTPVLTIAFAALAANAIALAQGFCHAPVTGAPIAADLNGTTGFPFASTSCRVQFCYGAEELEQAAFTATALSFRYDGPVPAAGNPGPHAIQRLRIAVGTSQVAQPGASFAGNLTQPLAPAFDGPWTYWLDPGTQSPTPFGEPAGALTFAFAQPIALALQPGEWLVVDMIVEGNAGAGMGHASLDALAGTGNPVPGSAANSGTGCVVPGAAGPATIATFGTGAPGAAYALHGTNLGANAAVLTTISLSDQTSSLGPLPLVLPGTSCALRTGFEVVQLRVAGPTGSIVGTLPGTWIAVPADPAFDGIALFHQHLAVAPGANAFGIVPSDSRAVVLGSAPQPTFRVWLAGNDVSAAAEAANAVSVRAPALRFSTL